MNPICITLFHAPLLRELYDVCLQDLNDHFPDTMETSLTVLNS
jgi:hypothetical protein